ncbi:MAG: tetratricopeptide repeat protein [Myxococcales bacterium]|nr:tetratricopeptide repeat protein [Myxococcales bacterium]
MTDAAPAESPATPSAPARAPSRWSKALPLVLFAVFTGVFAPTTRFEYVWDDVAELAENPLLHGPFLDGLLAVQSSQMGLAVGEDALLRPRYDSFRPVRFVSYWLDQVVHGASPAGSHAQNVLWATLALVLAFLLAREWLKSAPAALAVAAVFALHPMLVEPVAYVSARSDLLGGVFALAAALLVVRAVQREGHGGLARAYVPAGVLFLLSLASKEANVALPLVLALFAASRGRLRAHLLPLSALGLVAVGWFLLRGQLLRTSGGATPWPALRDLGSFVFQYVGAYLLPLDCSIARPLSVTLPWVGTLLVGALGLLMCAAAWRDREGLVAKLLPALAWAVLLLAPSVVAAAMHETASDRYIYLPSLGFSLALAQVGLHVAPQVRNGLAVMGACWLVICAAVTLMLVPTWETQLTLYERAVAVEPESTRAQYGVGLALARQGDCQGALPYFARAAALDSGNARAWTNQGVCLMRLGDLPAARAALEGALRASQGLYAPPWHNLAEIEFASGNGAAGCAAEQRALQLQPTYGPAQRNLAAYCAAAGQPD